jgi:hypothetical protein
MKKNLLSHLIYGSFGSVILFLTCLSIGENLIDSIIISSVHFSIKPVFDLFKSKKDEKILTEEIKGRKDEIVEVKKDSIKSLKYSSNR